MRLLKGVLFMNYIGSKYSLIDFLKESITDFAGKKPKVFADLFAGTGVVGSEFKQMGYQVISNDIQYYSYVLIKHLIENVPPLNQTLIEYLNSLKGIEGFVYNNYCSGSGSGRCYYTDENGKKCDAIRQEIERMRKSAEISDSEYFYLLASLINSIDKYANTASVYGAFLKKVKKSAEKEFILEPLPTIESSKNNKAYNEDINSLIKTIEGDILYLDPPYNERQYCANYHVLETIARYDNPMLNGKTGLRDYRSQKSAYCSKRTVAYVFEDLIKNAKFKYIFLSYNNEGLMSLNQIREIMSKYGEYTVYTKDYRRFRADKKENRNHKADVTTEYLHCLAKK